MAIRAAMAAGIEPAEMIARACRALALGAAFALALGALPARAADPLAVFDLANSPIADRGVVRTSPGGHSWVDPDGWYNMVLLSADAVRRDGDSTIFSYAIPGSYAEIVVQKVPAANMPALTAEDIERWSQAALVPGSPYEPKGIPLTARTLRGLGDTTHDGKRPVPLPTWQGIVTNAKGPMFYLNALVLTRRGTLRITCGSLRTAGQCVNVLAAAMRIERAAY